MPSAEDTGIVGQILLKQSEQNEQILSKQTEMGTQLAVISEQLKPIADHETRIRGLERFRYTIAGVSLFGGMLAGFVGYWIGHLIK